MRVMLPRFLEGMHVNCLVSEDTNAILRKFYLSNNKNTEGDTTMDDMMFTTKKKAIFSVVIYFLLFFGADSFNVLFWNLVFKYFFLSQSRYFLRSLCTVGEIAFTLLFFWLYTSKVLHLKMSFFRINKNIRLWGVLIAFILPSYVVFSYYLYGKHESVLFSTTESVLMFIFSLITAFKAGILEEMLFRGFIMKILETKWNKVVAVLAPSILFSLCHIPSMSSFSVIGAILLLIGGMLVSVMFSMITYKGDSIANSAIIHAIWNLFIVTDVLEIATEQDRYGKTLFSIIIPEKNILMTGGEFGVEVSIIAIIGYAVVCALILWNKKKVQVSQEGEI